MNFLGGPLGTLVVFILIMLIALAGGWVGYEWAINTGATCLP